MIKLTKKQASIYQQRWKRIAFARTQELQSSGMSVKFKQLCFLMNSFPFFHIDEKREKEVIEIRKRWILLKRKWGQGGH